MCPVHPSQGKRGSSVKNWCFFCVFGVPESVLRIVLTIRFASYGRFFRERKNERKSPKKRQKLGVFGDFFVFEATLCGNPAVQCQKLCFFCDFGVPESVVTIRFASYGLLQTLSRGEKRWFQTSLKLEGSETTCFSLHGHPEPSSDGFRGVSEWFQRGPKLCGFRGVPERSETVWFQRGFRVV